MDISEYVPIGRENAITRKELLLRTGLNDRQMRDCIKACETLICNLQDGTGYFIPASNEERIVRRYKSQESIRRDSIHETVKKCDKWIRENRKKENYLEKNQMSIFDFLKDETHEE